MRRAGPSMAGGPVRSLFDNAEKYICAAIFAVMTAIGFANVVVRYLTDFSLAATQEILLNGFLLLTVFGGALAARRGEHLAVTVFADLLPRRLRGAVVWLATALSVVLLLLAAWYCGELVAHQHASGVTSPGLQIPEWYYSLALPVGFVLIAVRMLQEALSARWKAGGEAAGA